MIVTLNFPKPSAHLGIDRDQNTDDFIVLSFLVFLQT